jgi:hypothetical protein
VDWRLLANRVRSWNSAIFAQAPSKLIARALPALRAFEVASFPVWVHILLRIELRCCRVILETIALVPIISTWHSPKVATNFLKFPAQLVNMLMRHPLPYASPVHPVKSLTRGLLVVNRAKPGNTLLIAHVKHALLVLTVQKGSCSIVPMLPR